jgi:hypothetical protein
VAAVLLELIKVERFTTYADLADALKFRCARLRIPYDSGIVSAALEQVEAVHGRLIELQPRRRRMVEREPEPVIIDRETAIRWLKKIDEVLNGSPEGR